MNGDRVGLVAALGFDAHRGDPHVWPCRGPVTIRGASVLLGDGEEVLKGCDNGRGDAATRRRGAGGPKARGGAVGGRPRARCWLAQQSAIIRGGAVGAQHRHLSLRRLDLHVHLLSARVEVVMETYRRKNGERFEPERNERAPHSIVERLELRTGPSEAVAAQQRLNGYRSGCDVTEKKRPPPNGNRHFHYFFSRPPAGRSEGQPLDLKGPILCSTRWLPSLRYRTRTSSGHLAPRTSLAYFVAW